MAKKKGKKVNPLIGKKHAYIKNGYKRSDNQNNLDYADFFVNHMFTDDFHGAPLPEKMYPQAKQFFEELVGAGMDPLAAIGIIGNIATESQFTPNAHSNFRGSFDGYVQSSPEIWGYIKKNYGSDHKGQLRFMVDGLKGELKGGKNDSMRMQLAKRFEQYRNDLAAIDSNDPYKYLKAANSWDDRYEISDYAGKPYRLGYAYWYGDKFVKDYPDYFTDSTMQKLPEENQYVPMLGDLRELSLNRALTAKPSSAVINMPEANTPAVEQQPVEEAFNDTYYLPQMNYSFNPFEGVFTDVVPDFGPVKLTKPGNNNKKPLLYLS